MKDNSRIYLAGRIGKIYFSHSVMGENFFETTLSVSRASGVCDCFKLIVPEIYSKDMVEGCNYDFVGSVRTRNIYLETGKSKVDLYVFVEDMRDYSGHDCNEAHLEGFLCKRSEIRYTYTNRTVIDFVLATHRATGKSDYIPCLVWGRYAERFSELPIGQKISAVGRLQSRPYTKKYEDGTVEEKVAYEISLVTYKVADDEESI